MENDKEIEQKKIIKEQIGIVSFLITCAVFLLRGMWYFYYCGYFKALNIDKSYLSIDNDTSLYSVLGLIGIALFLCVLNYWTYNLCIYKKRLLMMATVLIEALAMLGIICVVSNISVEDIIECFQITSWKGLGYVSATCFLCIFLINIYGFVFYIVFRNVSKEQDNSASTTFDSVIEILNVKNEKNIKRILIFIVFAIVVTVCVGICVFLTGMVDANEKTDFRIVEEVYSEKDSDIEEKYLFEDKNQTIKQYYVVLHETEDKYVVASLAFENGVIIKDFNRQKVISKENIITYYCSDIENSFWITEEMQNTDENVNTDKINQESEEDGSMVEAFGGALIGAIFTGICTFLIEKHNRKNEEKMEESHAASLLLYDLKSIEYYLTQERSSVNLRYTVNWQGIVASCSFLKDEQIQYIYKIYDETYNYNYYYSLKEQKGISFSKEDVPQYLKLKEILFDNSKGYIDEKNHSSMYEEIQNELKKHIL